MKIDVYSDVVCPWCYIGERRLDAALQQFAGAERVEVTFRPYQLDPGAGDEAAPLRPYLEKRYGPRAAAMLRHVSSAAAAEGITMDWDAALSGNTRTAHRLLRLAQVEYGADTQRALAERLFGLHFTRGGDILDAAQLTEEAVATGMDRARVEAYLASDEGATELADEFEQARKLGITAVPTFVFNGKYLVQGAQPAAALLEVLERVAAEDASSAPDEADGCADGACTA